MRRDRNDNGGNNQRGGRGGRGGRHGGGRGRGRNQGRGRGRGGRHSGRRRQVNSGNKRERIQIESGFLVVIDQFMLANPQFIEKIEAVVDEGPEKKDEIVAQYGGAVIEIEPALYRIERNPFTATVVIHQEGGLPSPDDLKELVSEELAHVLVDTRCMAMIDRELLDDFDLLEKYRDLWLSGEEKACRDLLRDNGGAVRYGFQRLGDELSIYFDQDENLVALWPRGSEFGKGEEKESGEEESSPEDDADAEEAAA